MVAVIVFRFSGIEDMIGKGQAFLQSFNDDATPYAETWPILRDKGPTALQERLKMKTNALRQPETWQICAGAQSAWWFRIRVTRVLWVALGFTVADIAACFVALPFTPRIACSSVVTLVVLCSTVGLGVICLGLYVWLIGVMMQRHLACSPLRSGRHSIT